MKSHFLLGTVLHEAFSNISGYLKCMVDMSQFLLGTVLRYETKDYHVTTEFKPSHFLLGTVLQKKVGFKGGFSQ